MLKRQKIAWMVSLCLAFIYFLVQVHHIKTYSKKKAYNPIEVKSVRNSANSAAEISTILKTSSIEQRNSSITNNVKTVKYLILYWGIPWNDVGSGTPEGAKIGKCTITNDRKRLPEADAVAFHYTTIKGSDLPWKHYRDPKQIFVWWSAEPPPIINREIHDLEKFNSFFNWTWTYRYDADVVRYYYHRKAAITNVKKGKDAIDNILRKKNKMALTLATNCHGTDGGKIRFEYGGELIKAGLKLDRIGKCFGNSHLLPRSDSQKMKNTIKEYKFYMAFENGIHCKDYITEKFWEISILNDAVPVVMGPLKIDYLRLAPIDSFIHVEDFESPQKLADYLNFLDKNETEYRKYFRWREDENMTDEIMMRQIREKYAHVQPEPTPKNICERISENRETKVVRSLLDEFAYNKPPECN